MPTVAHQRHMAPGRHVPMSLGDCKLSPGLRAARPVATPYGTVNAGNHSKNAMREAFDSIEWDDL